MNRYVDAHDNAVKMVTFAYFNRNLSIDDFLKKVRRISWIESMPDSIAECFMALGCVIHGKLSGRKRVDVWNTVFTLPSDGSSHKILLDSYFSKEAPSEDLCAVVPGMYHYWHDTYFWRAARDSFYRNFSFESAYVSGVCGGSSRLDDAGNLYFGETDHVVDFGVFEN